VGEKENNEDMNYCIDSKNVIELTNVENKQGVSNDFYGIIFRPRQNFLSYEYDINLHFVPYNNICDMLNYFK